MFAQEFRAPLAAIGFLTRIPVPTEIDAADLHRCGPYFPLVGAGIGAVCGTVVRRLGPAAGLLSGTLLTGALHLDALADSADALGAHDRERSLEIMRDSRIGSFGAVALGLDLMVRADALERCGDPVRALAVAGALSRALPVVLSAALPYARAGEGTGRALGGGGYGRAAAAVGVAAGLALTIGRDPGAIGVATLVGVASAALSRRRLGGVTGDTLGASIECCEAAVLLWSAR